MAFPPKNPDAPPRPKKGKSKQRPYALTFCRFTDDSTDPENHRYEMVKSTSVQSAHTALVKVLKKATGRDDIKKNHIVLIEASIIPPRMTMEEFLGLVDEDETEEE